jgi:2-amino-4-hydroxy-6-hydroxymethyldihydropteridine diphosphokinase
MFTVYLSLGANIEPVENLKTALDRLQGGGKIMRVSSIWQTSAVGSPGPDFINFSVLYETALEYEFLKINVLRKIEESLGRIRTQDKNAPRTMDIDIIIWNGQVIDQDLWKKAFIALPISELLPDLINGQTGETLVEVSKRLQSAGEFIIATDLASLTS